MKATDKYLKSPLLPCETLKDLFLIPNDFHTDVTAIIAIMFNNVWK